MKKCPSGKTIQQVTNKKTITTSRDSIFSNKSKIFLQVAHSHNITNDSHKHSLVTLSVKIYIYLNRKKRLFRRSCCNIFIIF